jgi:spermidine synthase
MNRLDKLLSYLYPITVELTSSSLNPVLEVFYQDGQYQLNSANANYSYGGLFELFKLIFKEVFIDWPKIDNVLILGFGSGCVVPLIQKYRADCNIVGVEIDEKVIELGKKYFNVDKLVNTVVVCDSAISYVNSTQQKFDLVIIDVYIDTNVPAELESLEFLKSLNEKLNCNGIVIFNKLLYNKEVKNQIPSIESVYREVFDEVNLYRIMHTGQIFVTKNKNQ